MFASWVTNWRDGFQWAHMTPPPDPDGPGLVWRETGTNYWSGSWAGLPRGTVMLESATDRWVAYVTLEEPPRPVTHHHRGPVSDSRQGDGGDG
jgi:hypothetical protein